MRPLGSHVRPTRIVLAVFMVLVVVSGDAALFVQPASAASGWAMEDDDFREETVLSGLSQPMMVEFLPDGRMLVLEKAGKMYIADPETGEKQVYMDLTSQTESGGERGLLDIALDPNFESNGYFYVFYSPTEGETKDRIARFTHRENAGGLTSRGDKSTEKLIWQHNRKWGWNAYHHGGGLDIGPDGKLYLTTGELFNGDFSQDLDEAAGKIIRVNRDGSVPSDNPYADASNPTTRYIWARGLRNPYRSFWDDGTHYIGEVGGNDRDVAQEDLHIGRKGANYGWPNCEGNCEDPAYDDPLYTYPHDPEVGGSITAGFVYHGDQFPATYDDDIFIGDYAQGWIKALNVGSNGDVTDVTNFHRNAGAVVALQEGPDGSLYYVQIVSPPTYETGSVKRITYEGSTGNSAPNITSATANTSSGETPLTVSFDGSATDADGDDLTYTWRFGDGASATGASISHTYDTSGQFDAVLEVSDGTTTATSNPIRISAGNAPTATIETPDDGTVFRAGEHINFSGSATDAEDGTLDPSMLEWTVVFLHDDHTHPVLGPVNGSGGEVHVEESGHDYSGDTGYRITLKATDSDGIPDTDVVTLQPDKVDVTLETSPTGLTVDLDQIPRETTYVADTLVGFKHTVEAPEAQCVAGTRYEFDSWSDGGERQHTLTVPDSDHTLTATYTANGSCESLPSDGLVAHFETESGVVTDGDAVTAWTDQSESGNDLTAVGSPTLVSDIANGRDVVRFDGTGDALERVGGLTLPTGESDRTVFFVADYREGGFGGVSWGAPQHNRAFGLVADANGDFAVQGWGSGNDFSSGVDAVGSEMVVQSATVQSGELTHYKDGVAIDSATHTFDTADDQLVVGAEMTPPPYLDMDVAALVVYDRALSATERQQVEAYLEDRYLGDEPEPGPSVDITSPDDGATITGSNVTVSWNATSRVEGDHVHLTLDDASTHTTVLELDGSHTFTDLSPGAHTVRVAVASAGHEAYQNPEANETVSFDVVEGDSSGDGTGDSPGDGTDTGTDNSTDSGADGGTADEPTTDESPATDGTGGEEDSTSDEGDSGNSAGESSSSSSGGSSGGSANSGGSSSSSSGGSSSSSSSSGGSGSSDSSSSASETAESQSEPSPTIDANTSVGEVALGENISVVATVRNTGDAPTEVSLDLQLNGTVVTTETVQVAGGEETMVELSYAPDEPGEYAVSVGDSFAGTVVVNSHNPAIPDNGRNAIGVSDDTDSVSDDDSGAKRATGDAEATSIDSDEPTAENGVAGGSDRVEDTDASEQRTETQTPGFGVLGAILALLVVALGGAAAVRKRH